MQISIQQTIVSLTLGNKCAFVRVLKEDEIGPASVFVSHAYTYDFADVVEVILLHEESFPNSFYWFDPFCMNQPDEYVISTEVLEKQFGEQIKGIGKTIIVASLWHEPQFLARAWCLFELYISVHTEVEVSIFLPERQRLQFIEGITKDWEGCINALERIDVPTKSKRFY